MVGVYKPTASNRIKFPLEIVSAEIKISPDAPVVAFGQAVAYRLFSAQTYVVMPRRVSCFRLGCWLGNADKQRGACGMRRVLFLRRT